MKKCLAFLVLLLMNYQFQSQVVNEPKDHSPEWSQPFQPFQIVGNLYYVGTYDLASYLIVTKKGNILINTGLADSLPIIKNNIKTLGFKYEDIKILLLTQAHFDHLGAMSAIKKETGAKLYVDFADAEALRDGGNSDYELGKYGVSFQPVHPDYLLKDKDVVKLGNMKLTMLHHPGHTKGACSFLFDVKDENKKYKVLIANMPTIIIDRKFSEVKAYPSIQKDYEYTLKSMKKLDFDIWLASHASQFGLHEKHKPNDSYNPKIFMNKDEYFQELEDLDKVYQEKLTQ